jgi:hypothetical protein
MSICTGENGAAASALAVRRLGRRRPLLRCALVAVAQFRSCLVDHSYSIVSKFERGGCALPLRLRLHLHLVGVQIEVAPARWAVARHRAGQGINYIVDDYVNC